MSDLLYDQDGVAEGGRVVSQDQPGGPRVLVRQVWKGWRCLYS